MLSVCETSNVTHNNQRQEKEVMKLKHRLYWLKDAARILRYLLKSKFTEAGLTHRSSASSVSRLNNWILICYVEDLLVLFQKISKIARLKRKLEKKFILKESGELGKLLNIKPHWSKVKHYKTKESHWMFTMTNVYDRRQTWIQPGNPRSRLKDEKESVSKKEMDQYRRYVGRF